MLELKNSRTLSFLVEKKNPPPTSIFVIFAFNFLYSKVHL